MNRNFNINFYLLKETFYAKEVLIIYILSAVFHLFLIGIFVFIDESPEKINREYLSAINVNLVSLPQISPKKDIIEKENKKVIINTSIFKKSEVIKKETTIKKKASSKPIRDNYFSPKKISMKKKSFSTQNALQYAIKQIEKKTQKSRPSVITEAIDRIKSGIKTKKNIYNNIKNDTMLNIGTDISKKNILKLIDIYKLKVKYSIQKNWAYPEQIVGEKKNLNTILIIKIKKNGEISSIWFDKRSGNSFLDESAYRAIQKANPLPPLPSGYKMPYFDVGLSFTPLGLN